MKSTGIVRNIDELGRIVIPMEIRKGMGISSSDPIEIFVENENIILRKHRDFCCICGKGDTDKELNGKKFCQTCLDELRAL